MTNPHEDSRYSGAGNLEVMLDAENYNRYLAQQVLKHGNGAERMLDFGAGIGTFAEMIRSRGAAVDCLEPDPRQAGSLTAKGFDTFRSPDELQAESYDYIYSLNVLEHIEDDLEATRAVFRLLKPGGRLYIYVPAFQALFGNMDRRVGHFRRYRRRQLEELLKHAGFTIQYSGYADSIGFFATLLYNLLPGSGGDINGSMIRVYDRVLFPASRLLDKLASPFFGKNVCAIASKPGDPGFPGGRVRSE